MTESNGAMTQDRLDAISRRVGEIARSDPDEVEAVLRELLAGLAYERGVCTTQAAVIKELRQALADPSG